MPLRKPRNKPVVTHRFQPMYLSRDIGKATIVRETMRAGFGKGLKKAGQADDAVVALVGDLTESVCMTEFKEAFAHRFINVGVTEQNLVTVAAGLAATGKKPFAASYAAFSPGRNWEQIRTTICLNEQPVVVVGSHAGLSVGPDGATHQMLEDIALMRILPHMTVVAPADSIEAEKATQALAELNTPSYIRLARESTPVFTTYVTPFEIGKAYVLRPGTDVTLLATGTMTYQCLVAADIAASQGVAVEVVHVPTIKPLDAATIVKSAKKTGRVVTVEEGQIAAGFGSAVAELLAEALPVPVKRLGVRDCFGESGSTEQLWKHHRLDVESIAASVKAWAA